LASPTISMSRAGLNQCFGRRRPGPNGWSIADEDGTAFTEAAPARGVTMPGKTFGGPVPGHGELSLAQFGNRPRGGGGTGPRRGKPAALYWAPRPPFLKPDQAWPPGPEPAVAAVSGPVFGGSLSPRGAAGFRRCNATLRRAAPPEVAANVGQCFLDDPVGCEVQNLPGQRPGVTGDG